MIWETKKEEIIKVVYCVTERASEKMEDICINNKGQVKYTYSWKLVKKDTMPSKK